MRMKNEATFGHEARLTAHNILSKCALKAIQSKREAFCFMLHEVQRFMEAKLLLHICKANAS